MSRPRFLVDHDFNDLIVQGVGHYHRKIRIEADGNSGNVITGNKLRHNAEHDCHDDTVGTGTAGTANTWEKNEGDTENRPGLCRKKP